VISVANTLLSLRFMSVVVVVVVLQHSLALVPLPTRLFSEPDGDD